MSADRVTCRIGAMQAALRRGLVLVLSSLMLVGMSGCSAAGYYWQAVTGHLDILQRTRPVPDWLAAPETADTLRERLRLSQRIRDFAVAEMKLPDNASYRSYADLGRPFVVWNLVAAPSDSLKLKTWCFVVVGCVSYRGYFAEADARAEAAALAAQGWEVQVYGVPAYSTLGWMNAFGGDPLLNTFLFHHEGDLARLIFHELAHQVLYVADDSSFNESFATAVERLGVRRWLRTQASPATRVAYEAHEARRQQFRALTRQTRAELDALFVSRPPDLIARKAEIMARFRDRHADLKASWGGFAGYDRWVAQANNASLAGQGTYDDGVPAFEALYERAGGDWSRFYDAVRALAEQPVAERRRFLKEP